MARTRGHFWTVKPAKILLAAVIGTQLTATLLTVYGILLPAMGWGLAAFVWGYALALFVATDFLKVQFYKILDRKADTLSTKKQDVPLASNLKNARLT